MRPKKSLGQNFLRCQWVVDAIISASDLTRDDTVIEVGPGTGILTSALAKRAGSVVAIEKDEKLAAELRRNLEKENIKNVEITEGDILKILPDLPSRYKLQAKNYKLIANIPYYLTARLLRMLFEAPVKPSLITLTIQKEVAERIAAKPPQMSILAVSVQAYGNPEIIKHVPASCFYPVPNVNSSIIKISGVSDIFFKKNAVSEQVFFEIAKLGFSAKRKQLLGNLSKKFTRQEIGNIFSHADINPRARAEELSLEEWVSVIKGLEPNALS